MHRENFTGGIAVKIRKSKETDVKKMMEIYAYARNFMAEHGNPNQWGPTNWSPEELIHNDIKTGRSYVCVDEEDQVLSTFFYDFGPGINVNKGKVITPQIISRSRKKE